MKLSDFLNSKWVTFILILFVSLFFPEDFRAINCNIRGNCFTRWELGTEYWRDIRREPHLKLVEFVSGVRYPFLGFSSEETIERIERPTEKKVGLYNNSYCPPKSFHNQIPSIKVSSDQPYIIGAWYFTGWNSSNHSLISLTKKHYGREGDPWGGVRDYALGYDPFNIGVDYSDRIPLLGFYDQMNQEIIDTHIRQAASRGLSFFAIYWYWDVDKNQEAAISAPLHRFISSSQKNKIKFMIAPIMLGTMGEGQSTTLENWQNKIVPYMVDNYISDPYYLRTEDGRPIINIFSVNIKPTGGGKFSRGSLSSLRKAIEVLKVEVLRKSGRTPVILVRPPQTNHSEDLLFIKNNLNIDGFQCFNIPIEKQGEAYENTLFRWAKLMEKQKTFLHIPCTNTGVDNRPWYLSWGETRPDCTSLSTGCFYTTNIKSEIFEQHLKTIKEYLDENPNSTCKMLTIYAWNEWGEGGAVEPNKKEGYKYLDIIQNVFGLSSRYSTPYSPHDTATPSIPSGFQIGKPNNE